MYSSKDPIIIVHHSTSISKQITLMRNIIQESFVSSVYRVHFVPTAILTANKSTIAKARQTNYPQNAPVQDTKNEYNYKRCRITKLTIVLPGFKLKKWEKTNYYCQNYIYTCKNCKRNSIKDAPFPPISILVFVITVLRDCGAQWNQAENYSIEGMEVTDSYPCSCSTCPIWFKSTLQNFITGKITSTYQYTKKSISAHSMQ